jgi:very-short-patch-repair endonuclease
MDGKSASPDGAVARMAARQHGVVSIRQLREAGVSDDAARARVRAGRLHRVHRGVYAVGHPRLSLEGRWMAALLACGSGEATVVLSHRAAAALWGLLPPADGAVDVSVAGSGGRRRRRGVRIHRSSTLTADQTTRRRGIPVTTPARTLADLRRAVIANGLWGSGSHEEVRRAIRQAEALGLPPGDENLGDRTRSELERRFLRLCRSHGLPAPEVNTRIGRFEVDFLWPDRRVIVETDGYRYHRGRVAFEDDRARDLALRALGYDVVRLTHRQLMDEPAAVASVLRSLRT